MMNLGLLELNSLEKGSVISAEVLEAVTGERRESKAFALACLKLRPIIYAHFERERGVRVRLAMRGDNLHVLIDREMADRAACSFRLRMAGMERDHADQLAVNVANFTETEKRHEERRVCHQAMILQAISSAKKSISLTPTLRRVPTLREDAT